MAVLEMSGLFPTELTKEIFSKVQGHSSIAQLSAQSPISFTGNDVFVFGLDDEVNLVAESGEKAEGKTSVNVVKMVPVKVEYTSRVSDEFLYASEEKQMDMLGAFTEGYAKKIARGLDIMAMHGVNPRDGQASSLIGTNSFDTNTDVASVTYSESDPEANITDAIADIGEYDLNGIAMSKTFAAALAKLTVNGVKQYPELGWGANPGTVNGCPVDVNSTVSYVDGKQAYVGDFRDAFKWGFAKEIPLEIIPYGDPDGLGDLKKFNQVCLRAEAWIGWAILVPGAFARIEASTANKAVKASK